MSYRHPNNGQYSANVNYGASGDDTYGYYRSGYAPGRDDNPPSSYHLGPDGGPRPQYPPPLDHQYYARHPTSYSPDPYGMRGTPPPILPPFAPSHPVQQRAYHSNPSSRVSSPGRQPSTGPYVPTHVRGSTPEPSTAASRGPASPSHRGGRREPAPYVPTLPPPEYLELSRPITKATQHSSSIVPKLLVLDLNGALIYRSGSRSTERMIYPRPYLGNFLEYLFGPRPDVPVRADFGSDSRPWEVFVWSSAQPHNVRAMVENGFGRKWIEGVYEEEESSSASAREKGEGRLLGVWARDKMDLSSNDYNRKVQTFKDLRKVLTHLAEPEGESSRPPHVFDEKRVFLLDDSPLKAVNQPWNQLVVPEYDVKEFQAAKEAIRSDDPLADGSGMDRALLAVIGILEELTTIENVPAWVRAGGLMANQEDDIGSAVGRLSVDRDVEVTLEDLPSHDSFQHWHTVPSVFQHWVDKGVTSLESRGIKVDHGLDSEGRSKHMRPASSRSGSPPGHYPTAYQNTRRAWSPSAPSSPSRDGVRSPSPDRSSWARDSAQGESQRRHFTSEAHREVDETQLRESDHEPPLSTHSSLTAQADAQETVQTASQLHVPPGVRTDSWRTLNASDVSAYLVLVADRVSTLFHQQDQEAIRTTARLLSSNAAVLDRIGLDEREVRGSFMSAPIMGVGEGDGVKSGESSGVKRARTKGRREKKAAKKRVKTHASMELRETARRSKSGLASAPAKETDSALSMRAGQAQAAIEKPTSKQGSDSGDPAHVNGSNISQAMLSQTNGWTPSPDSLSRVVEKLDAQSLQDSGRTRQQTGHRPLPRNRPADISPSLWERIREVSDETKSRKKSWGLAMRTNIVHLAMYREHVSPGGSGAIQDEPAGHASGGEDARAPQQTNGSKVHLA